MNMLAATLVFVFTYLELIMRNTAMMCPGVGQCKNVQTVPSAPLNGDPVYVRFVESTPDNRRQDSICITFGQLPGSNDIYQTLSIIYCDGSSEIRSYFITALTGGLFRVSNTTCLINEYQLGFPGCNTFLLYECFMSGDCVGHGETEYPTLGVSSTYKNPITCTCLGNAKQIANANGITPLQYYVLPYKYPVNCVTSPVCQ